jgi:integrase
MTTSSEFHSNRFDFSKRLIDLLPYPPNGAAYYYDLRTKGLALSVGTSGRKSFLLYRKIKGKPERIKIGPYPDISIEQARRSAAVLNARIAQSENPAQISRDRRDQLTLAEMFKKYYLEHSQVRKITHKEDLGHFNLHIDTKAYGINLSLLPLTELTKSVLTSHHAKMGASIPTTANRVLALISSIFSKAIQWGDFDGNNPCRGIQKFNEQSRDRFVQPDEMPKLFLAMECETNENIRDFIFMALFTGARRTNILQMKWADVHIERKEWRISRTKNGDPQTIPLTDAAIEILKIRKAVQADIKTTFVFPGPGKTGHFVEPKTAWARVLLRATAIGLVGQLAEKSNGDGFNTELAIIEARDFPKIAIEKYLPLANKFGIHIEHVELRDLHIHDLRRTLGSWLASGGTSLPIIGKVLNHRSPQATQVYARLMLGPVRSAMEEASIAFKAAGNSQPQAIVE